MIDCCFLALALAIANIITLAIFAGYTVKLRERQFILEQRNGKELKELAQLKEEIQSIRSSLGKEVRKLKEKKT